ncbi:hypothetical protein [Desulfitobacterium hafniense]|uniref:hypothetical protein n=1 Tax=Desulfitobacterium hafniense TaxID=49338 RepID=UPI0003798AF5|nr:hypothetical protein [Desulfitobacterium hafniense]
MEIQTKIESWVSDCENKGTNELRQFRLILSRTIQAIDLKLDSIDKTKKIDVRSGRCPHCKSSHTKGYGLKPPRFYCLDCHHAFVKERAPLYYRKRNPLKILDLIVTIHTTDKSIPEITSELKISLQTYYKWKREIIQVFPQLEEKFNLRGKKPGKL